MTAILPGRPEIMVHGISSAYELEPLLLKITVIVIGPDLGKTPWSYELLHRTLTAPQEK